MRSYHSGTLITVHGHKCLCDCLQEMFQAETFSGFFSVFEHVQMSRPTLGGHEIQGFEALFRFGMVPAKLEGTCPIEGMG